MGLGLSTALNQGHWGQKEGVYKAQSTWPRVISLAWYSTGGGTCGEEGLAQGYHWEKLSEGQTLPAGRGPAV